MRLGDGWGVMGRDAASAFINSGIVRKDVGTAVHGMLFDIATIHNEGVIEVTSGTLQLGGVAAWNSYVAYTGTTSIDNEPTGSLVGSPGTTLAANGVLTSNGTISSGGTVGLQVGQHTIAGDYTAAQTVVGSGANFTGTVHAFGNLNVSGTADIVDATLDASAKELASLLLSGTLITDEHLSVAGTFTWAHGTLRGANGQGSLTANGDTSLGRPYSPGSFLEQGFHYINAASGTLTETEWDSGFGYGVWLDHGSVFENRGTMRLGDGWGVMGRDAASAFINSGIVRKDVGVAGWGSTFDIAVIHNEGLIEVTSGKLSLGGNESWSTFIAYTGTTTITNEGELVGSPGTTLAANGVLTNAGTISSGGTVGLQVGQHAIAGDYTADQTVVGSGASFTGTVHDFGALSVSGTADMVAATLDASAKQLASLSLSGTLVTDEDLSVAGPFTWNYGTLQGVSGIGSLTVLGDTTLNRNLAVRDFKLINAAEMIWTDWTIKFYGAGSSFVNAAGAKFDDRIDGTFGSVDGNCVRFVNEGYFVKSGGAGTTYLQMQLYNRGTVEIQQGRLFLGCGYVSNDPGNPPAPGIDLPPGIPWVVEDPDPRPLPPAEPPVVVPGSYTQTVTGLLIEQIAGHTGPGVYGVPGTDYGQLVVMGDVALAGSLEVQVLGAFVPSIGQQYLVIDNRGSNPIGGTFIGLDEGAIAWAGLYGFAVSYSGGDGNDFVLTMDRFANTPPTARASGPYMVDEGGTVALSAAASSDAQQSTASLSFAWDLDGDNVYGETGADAQHGVEIGMEPAFSATGLDGPTSLTVHLRVTDNYGASDTASVQISVLNVAPTATLTASNPVAEGSPIELALVDAFDPSAADTAAGFTYAFDCGDGAGYGGWGAANSFSCATSDPGTRTVRARIRDKDGDTREYTTTVTILPLPTIAGRVFDDANNDGLFVSADGDMGLEGVTVNMYAEDTNALVATVTTAGDGTYLIDARLSAGSYRLVRSSAPGMLDGRETAGNLGGGVDNAADSDRISAINLGPAGSADAVDYLFAQIRPSNAFGLVWLDFNDDGEVNFGEQAIEAAIVELTGHDDRGNPVSRTAVTDSSGVYSFFDLRPSDAGGYAIHEVQPGTYADGKDAAGMVNGVATGTISANDTIAQVVIPRPNSIAENYNFAERAPSGGAIAAGQTATIGFWQNKNGQNLIKSLNGGSSGTQLGHWLAATFPNMYGTGAGAGSLAGKTNAEVAAYYKILFSRNGNSAAGGGPPKMEAQVLATALAVYVTNQTLAGSTAVAFGFTVSQYGAGAAEFNVGSRGAAFGLANNATATVLDLLLAVNARSTAGRLYDLDDDGDANDALETLYRTLANDLFTAINEAG
jgi:hypothetical protein